MTPGEAEDALRGVEKILESVGRSICDVKGSATAHGRINGALEQVRLAIGACCYMAWAKEQP